MSLNRSSTDGGVDERPYIRCSACKQLAKCYRGPLVKVVQTEAGPFEHHRWLCSTCFAAEVAEALRDS